jgi:hypothetical protein
MASNAGHRSDDLLPKFLAEFGKLGGFEPLEISGVVDGLQNRHDETPLREFTRPIKGLNPDRLGEGLCGLHAGVNSLTQPYIAVKRRGVQHPYNGITYGSGT